MKKWLYRMIVVLFALIPMVVKADDGIKDFYIKATLQKNGDLEVEEYFYLTGKYNGFERIIKYENDEAYLFNPDLPWYGGSSLHNGTGIQLTEIRALEQDSSFDFTSIHGQKFKAVNSAKKGDYGVYTIASTYGGNSYRIYLPSSKKQAFYLKYTLKNMAILHEDVGELGWNVVGDQLSEDIENLKVQVHFPDNETEFRVWAHGPLHGNVQKVSNQILEAGITNLSRHHAIDIRVTFDKEIIADSTKKSNVQALAKILAYEDDAAAQANYERENKEQYNEHLALEEIISCEQTPSRSCYTRALRYVDNITDETVANSYQNRLEDLKIKVTEREEQVAIEELEFAEKYLGYYQYKYAKEKIIILENETLRNELSERLEIVREKIIAQEEKVDQKYKTFSGILLFVILIICLYIYIKYDKEYKPSFKEEYLRDIPNHFSPTTVSYLFKKKIINSSVSAEILDLIRRKEILYEKDTNSKKEDYILRRNLNSTSVLSEKENRLLKLIFNNRDEITLQEMKKKAKQSSSSMVTNWNNFKHYALKEARAEKMYENDTSKKGLSSEQILLLVFCLFFMPMFITFWPIFLVITLGILIYRFNKHSLKLKFNFNARNISITLLVIVFILSIFTIFLNIITNHIVHNSIKLTLLVSVFSIISVIYVMRANRKTKEGIEEYAKWKAFKRFLNDFGSFDEKELPEVALWEQYLVYAVVLGCADKLSKVMKVKLEEMHITSDIDFSDIYVMTHVTNQVSRTLTSSIRTAERIQSASSSGSSSSGSGGGGGFSSGGGSFGGGGGGGRF